MSFIFGLLFVYLAYRVVDCLLEAFAPCSIRHDWILTGGGWKQAYYKCTKCSDSKTVHDTHPRGY